MIKTENRKLFIFKFNELMPIKHYGSTVIYDISIKKKKLTNFFFLLPDTMYYIHKLFFLLMFNV